MDLVSDIVIQAVKDWKDPDSWRGSLRYAEDILALVARQQAGCKAENAGIIQNEGTAPEAPAADATPPRTARRVRASTGAGRSVD